MSDKKKKKEKKTGPTAPRPKERPDIHDEGSFTSMPKVEVKKGGSLKKAMMGGGKVGKPIKYEVGGMVKPAYMRNR